jgi:hypothetical protein
MTTGHCACGQVCYRLNSAPSDAGYCHCEICRRSSGAPVLAFATVPLDDFVITKGEPLKRRSSSFGERWFCAACGSQIAMHVDHQPATIDFTVATMDSPELARPAYHIWFDSRIAWFDPDDGLPRYAKFRPQTHGIDPI